MPSLKYHFECTDCGAIYTDNFLYLCPKCAALNKEGQPPMGVLKTVYNYDKIKALNQTNTWNSLKQTRYIDLLPIKSSQSFGYLKVGHTPVYSIDAYTNVELFIKDDSQNPTFSFKDRASALVSAYAKENDLNILVAASTGNAGSSLAGICASQSQKAVIIVPENVPSAKLVQIIMYGAIPVLVKGNYDTAFDLSLKATEVFGWHNRNTAFNPFTIEGKKTVAFEIFDRFGEQLPDYIFVPVGDGVIIAGVYKGFEDLLKLGIISKIPTIVSVQSAQSCNLNNNLASNSFNYVPSTTLADSISVDIPRNFLMAKKFLLTYDGESINISDHEIVKASGLLAKTTGIFAEPAASAAYAGFLKFKNENQFKDGSRALVLLTGSGLKDLKTALNAVKLPEPIEPTPTALDNYLQNSRL